MLGGNGYVEEVVDAAPLPRGAADSVEGSGNVNALDVLRALAREPEALEAWITEVGLARGGDARLDAAINTTLALLREVHGDPDGLEVGARHYRPDGRRAPGLAPGAHFSPPRWPTSSAPHASGRRTTGRSARSPAACRGIL